MPGLLLYPGFTGNGLRPEDLVSSASVMAASLAVTHGFLPGPMAYTIYPTATVKIASHEPKAISDLFPLSLPFSSLLLRQVVYVASLKKGPSPWAKQLFTCGISGREQATEDCLLVTPAVAGELNSLLLRGSLKEYP